MYYYCYMYRMPIQTKRDLQQIKLRTSEQVKSHQDGGFSL